MTNLGDRDFLDQYLADFLAGARFWPPATCHLPKISQILVKKNRDHPKTSSLTSFRRDQAEKSNKARQSHELHLLNMSRHTIMTVQPTFLVHSLVLVHWLFDFSKHWHLIWTRNVMVSWQRHYHCSTLTVVYYAIMVYLFLLYDRILTVIAVLSRIYRIESKFDLLRTQRMWLCHPPPCILKFSFHFISYHINLTLYRATNWVF